MVFGEGHFLPSVAFCVAIRSAGEAMTLFTKFSTKLSFLSKHMAFRTKNYTQESLHHGYLHGQL
jgi:hypothetical protein